MYYQDDEGTTASPDDSQAGYELPYAGVRVNREHLFNEEKSLDPQELAMVVESQVLDRPLPGAELARKRPANEISPEPLRDAVEQHCMEFVSSRRG